MVDSETQHSDDAPELGSAARGHIGEDTLAHVPRRSSIWLRVPLLLYGIFLSLAGVAIYLLTTLASVLGTFVVPGLVSSSAVARILLSSGALVWAGAAAAAFDLLVLLTYKRDIHDVIVDAPAIKALTVVLTAYNDEESIGLAVDDFRSHPLVRRIIVIDNNSTDRTSAIAEAHGATVIHEPQPGYGRCVYRALEQGASHTDTELTLLCEGDMTFRAYDVDKFLAYIPHADIVNGTRIVEQLRAPRTQLTTFMYYGNFFVGKLLEAKHVGKGTFTDVGTTYKLCRNSAVRKLLPILNSAINLEFNAHFLDMALSGPLHVVECPITFHNRVGLSKGGNTSNMRAFRVGMRMIRGIVFRWPHA